jgi:hypothetical protein
MNTCSCSFKQPLRQIVMRILCREEEYTGTRDWYIVGVENAVRLLEIARILEHPASMMYEEMKEIERLGYRWGTEDALDGLHFNHQSATRELHVSLATRVIHGLWLPSRVEHFVIIGGA